MLDEYTDEFSTNLDKHTVIQPQAAQPHAHYQPHQQQYQQPLENPSSATGQPYIKQGYQAPQYQAPIYQQHVYQQPVFQTPTVNPGQPTAPQNYYQPAVPPGAEYPQSPENTRINNVFGEESKELNELLKAEQGNGCLKTSLFILLCIAVVCTSFWVSFSLGSKIFFPNTQTIKQFLPRVQNKFKNTFSTADIVKVQTEFKHDLAAEPVTPILPPEVRPQPIEAKPVPRPAATYKPKPRPLPATVARAANPPLKKGMYRVVAGAYTTHKEAEDVLANIKADGFPSYIYKADNKYRIQIGAFKTKAAAEELRKKALEYGYNAFVSIY